MFNLFKRPSILNIGNIKNSSVVVVINDGIKYGLNNFFFSNVLSLISGKVPRGQGLNKYVYNVKGLPFVGRDEYITELENFCASSKPFAWHTLTGAAGTGKSRLALEFSRKIQKKGWIAGFVNNLESINHQNILNSKKPSFIVIDYIVGREKRVSELISTLFKSLENGPYKKIRILLLEREIGSWMGSFLQKGSSDGATLEHCSYNSLNPLKLELLCNESQDQQLNFIDSLLGHFEIDKKTGEEFLNDILKINPNATYLFCYIFADIYQEAKNSNSKEEVFRELLKKEENKRWIPNKILSENESKLILATISGGIPIKTLANLTDLKNIVKKHRIMVGSSDFQMLEPLFPDLLGELFVLDSFRFEEVLLKDKFDNILQESIELGSHEQLISFFTRCSIDYPSHCSLGCLGKPFEFNSESILTWSKIIVNMMLNVENFNIAENLLLSFENLIRLVGLQQRELPILFQVAFHNFLYKHSGIPEMSKWIYLFDYSYNYSGLAPVAQKIQIGQNVEITAYGTGNAFLLAEMMELSRLKIPVIDYDYTCTLGKSLKEVIKISPNSLYQNALSECYFNQELYLIDKLDSEALLKVHDEFYDFIESSEVINKVVVLKYLGSCKNIIGSFYNYNVFKADQEKKIELIEKYLGQFTLVDIEIKNSKEYIIEFSEFLFGALSYVKPDKKRSWTYYKEIEKLIQQYPQFSDLLYFMLSKGAVNLSSGFKTIEELSDFEKKLIQLELYQSQNQISRIREMLGRIYGNLVNHNSNEIISDEIKEGYFEKHKKLCFDHPAEHELAKGLLRGVTIKHANLLNIKEFESAKVYFELISKIVKINMDKFGGDFLYSINNGVEHSEQKKNIVNLEFYSNMYIENLEYFIENHLSNKVFLKMHSKLESIKHGKDADAISDLYNPIFKRLCDEFGDHPNFKGVCNYFFPQGN